MWGTPDEDWMEEPEMVTLAGRSTRAGLKAKQKILKAELRQVDKEIHHEEETLARIEGQIRILEKGSRQAA